MAMFSQRRVPTITELARGLLRVLGQYEPRLERIPAILGDGQGHVEVDPDNAPGLVHIRDSSGVYMGKAVNNAVPNYDGAFIIVGYDYRQPDFYKVLGLRETGQGNAPGGGNAYTSLAEVAPHQILDPGHKDTDTTVTPADGDVLTYVGTSPTGKWTPAANAAGQPDHAEIFADMLTTGDGWPSNGSSDMTYAGNQRYQTYCVIAANKSVTFLVEAGTYRLTVLGIECTCHDSGDTLFKIDGTTVLTYDWSAATGGVRDYNVVVDADDDIALAAGEHTLLVDVETNSVQCDLTKFWLYQV